MTLADLVALGVLGGLVALDGTALGQFMVSRPLVAATLAGALLGDATLGLAVGGVLELFYLSALPVGGARFPEGGPAAVVAAAAAVAAGGMPGLAAGVAVGMVWGTLGGHTVGWLRRLNARLAPDPSSPLLTPAAVGRVQFTCLVLDFVRGAFLASLGSLLGALLAGALHQHWPLDDGWTVGLLLVGAAVPLGALLRSFGLRPLLLLAGLAGGLLLGTLGG